LVTDVRNFKPQFPIPGRGSDPPATEPIQAALSEDSQACNLETTQFFPRGAQLIGLYETLDSSYYFLAAWCQYSVRSLYERALVETTTAHTSTSSPSIHFGGQVLVTPSL